MMLLCYWWFFSAFHWQHVWKFVLHFNVNEVMRPSLYHSILAAQWGSHGQKRVCYFWPNGKLFETQLRFPSCRTQSASTTFSMTASFCCSIIFTDRVCALDKACFLTFVKADKLVSLFPWLDAWISKFIHSLAGEIQLDAPWWFQWLSHCYRPDNRWSINKKCNYYIHICMSVVSISPTYIQAHKHTL